MKESGVEADKETEIAQAAEKEADIVIKVDLPEDEEEKKPHASVSLQIRKTLEGNLSITDHEDITGA